MNKKNLLKSLLMLVIVFLMSFIMHLSGSSILDICKIWGEVSLIFVCCVLVAWVYFKIDNMES